MAHSIRRTDSLFSLCVDHIIKNLSKYEDDINVLKYYPANIKSCLLKKFLSSSCFWTSISFHEVLSILIHPLIQCIDLSSATVTDETLNLLKDCHQLREVYLTRVKNYDLSSQALINFLSPLKNLFMLQLSNCEGVNDEVLIVLSKSCPALAGLDVGGCVQVTDVSLEAMSTMENLQWLTYSATQVSNKGIERLVNGPSREKIKELRLSNCTNISDNILQEIVHLCSNIEVLVFYNMQRNENINTGICVPIPRGSSKNLKQLMWAVHW